MGLGCAQGEGERCQIDSDCKSGLTCQNLGSSLYSGNGVCTSTSGKSTGDASVKLDTSTSVRPDSAIQADALSRDGGDARVTTDATDARLTTDALDARATTDAADTRVSSDGRAAPDGGTDVSVTADARVDAPLPDASSDVQPGIDGQLD